MKLILLGTHYISHSAVSSSWGETFKQQTNEKQFTLRKIDYVQKSAYGSKTKIFDRNFKCNWAI